jgi:hypothetical protein
MARIIVHNTSRGTVNDTGAVTGNGSETGNDAGMFEQIGEPITGQSSGYVNQSASDDNGTGNTGTGNSTSYVDPTTGTVSGTDTGTRKRRRRSDAGFKRGTRTRTSRTEETQDIKSLLLMIHFGLAGFLHAPKLKLSEQEAEQLAVAANRLREFYPDISVLSPKAQAWFNLAICCGLVYGPKFRKDKPSPTHDGTVTGKVVDMPFQPTNVM